eukprot:gene6119-8434_t
MSTLYCFANDTLQPSGMPSNLPTAQPTIEPSSQPSITPTYEPTIQPSSTPSIVPTILPSSFPSTGPTTSPSSFPSVQPSFQPLVNPTNCPTSNPTNQPSAEPTTTPTNSPRSLPTSPPSITPTSSPSKSPTRLPSSQPSSQPSGGPSSQPSIQPFSIPTRQPSQQPTINPTKQPTLQPSRRPTNQPTRQPFQYPTSQPSKTPSQQPSNQPSRYPSTQPTYQPISSPTSSPTNQPSIYPSNQPSSVPSDSPSSKPSINPSSAPTMIPTTFPSSQPTDHPSTGPTSLPTREPSRQPSVFPSCSPSCDPTIQPSSSPTIEPTSQPTFNPSSSPTAQPFDFPSATPTFTPSSAPSQQPSTPPSSKPSENPSARPSNNPTMHPSSTPTVLPTNVPSVIPTSNPTINPTTDPTNSPTSFPSVFPSSQPTNFPTMIPSSSPKATPTTSPTSYPSAQPYVFPTNQPTYSPSIQPSQQPSKMPTDQPTKQPLRRPTCQPSQSPSSQPSKQPNKQPSNQPTRNPRTKRTRRPTKRPSCCPTIFPTSTPSFAPTYTTGTKWSDRIIELLSQRYQVTSPFSEQVYSITSVAKGHFYYETCNAWYNFLYGKLYESKLNKKYISVQIETITDLTQTNDNLYSKITCSNITTIELFISTMTSSTFNSNITIECHDSLNQSIIHNWKFINLRSRQWVICIDCDKTSDSVNPIYFNPCNMQISNIGTIVDYGDNIQFFSVILEDKVKAPEIISQSIINVTNNSMDLVITLNKTGIIRCYPFFTSYANQLIDDNSSVFHHFDEIESSPFTAYVTNSSHLNTIIYFKNLQAMTNYSSICLTQSLQQSSKLSRHLIAKTIRPFQTLCCKEVHIQLSNKYFYVGNYYKHFLSVSFPDDITYDLLLSFELFLYQNNSLVKLYDDKISIESTNITFNQSNNYGRLLSRYNAEMNKYQFDLDTMDLSITNSISEYYISINLSSSFHNNPASVYSFVSSSPLKFYVMKSYINPNPPIILSAIFNSDGSNIIFTFDSPTNKGGVLGYSTTCNNIFNFTCSELCTCIWSNDLLIVKAILHYKCTVKPYDTIILLPNITTGQCLDSHECSTYNYSSQQLITIIQPSNIILPNISLALPSRFISCENLPIDLTGSYGSGGRSWFSVAFIVTSISLESSNDIVTYQYDMQSFLLRNYTMNRPLSVPSSMLAVDTTYTITAKFCNFLQNCGVASATVTIESSNTQILFVTISGSFYRTISKTDKNIRFDSLSYYPNCVNHSILTNNSLNYIWSIQNVNNTVLPIQSISKNPMVFLIPTSELIPNSFYYIQLIVLDLVTYKSNSAYVTIYVTPSSLVARIKGSFSQAVSVYSYFSLDGSESYDPDALNNSLNYKWSCFQLSPSYGSCNILNFLQSDSSMDNSVITFYASSSTLSSIVMLSLTVYDIVTQRTSQTYVNISIVSVNTPKIRLTSFSNNVKISSNGLLKYNPNEALILSAYVNMPANSGTAIWKTDDPSIAINSSFVSSTPTSTIISPTSNLHSLYSEDSISFIINPNILTIYSSNTITFQLKLTNNVNTNTYYQAFLTLSMNSPPLIGKFNIYPNMGIEYQTLYYMSISQFQDDDLPLTYQIGYYDINKNYFTQNEVNLMNNEDYDNSHVFGNVDYIILSSKSELSHMQSFLPIGKKENNYFLVCVAAIFDNFDANSTKTRAVIVNENTTGLKKNITSTSQMLANTNKIIQKLLFQQNITAKEQYLNLAITSINTITSCDVAIPCFQLNRYNCSVIPDDM